MTGSLNLSDAEEAELHRLMRRYHREAKRCQTAKAYLAGCVMAAAVMEAALILMVSAFPEEAEATGKSSRKELLRWDLGELLNVAKAAGWLPAGLEIGKDDWLPRKAKVGDRAEVLRLIRDLLHPGRHTREHLRQRVTKQYLEFALNVVFEVNDCLCERIAQAFTDR